MRRSTVSCMALRTLPPITTTGPSSSCAIGRTGPDSVEFYSLYGHLSRDSLEGLWVGQPIAKGAVFARVGSAPSNGDWWPHVHVQLVTDLLDVPVQRRRRRSREPAACLAQPLSRPEPDPWDSGWRATASSYRSRQSLAARHAHVGGNVRVSYGASPLNIVRGWKQYLYDDAAHRFIDAYNNVAHVGHCHPRVVRAVSEQLAVLNTNTRYLQEQLTEYAEQLTALLAGVVERLLLHGLGQRSQRARAPPRARTDPGARCDRDGLCLSRSHHDPDRHQSIQACGPGR